MTATPELADVIADTKAASDPEGAAEPRASLLHPERVQLRGMSKDELTEYVKGLGQPAYRAKQLYSWIQQKGARSFDEMSNISKALRQQLQEKASLTSIEPDSAYDTPDTTTKLGFKLSDGAVVESVVIPAERRVTLCVSSQVGCAMGCTFCRTAQMGLVRHLSVAEIVDQVAWARRLWEPAAGRAITNIVFMGMGEPLHNYDNVTNALRIILDSDGLDFSRRRLTVSTSGLVPAIEKLGAEPDLNVRLAVSLNASNDEVRDRIMPVNKRWNIAALVAALKRYPIAKRERITMEYVMLAGVNDSMADAKRLKKVLHGLRCKVNLIPWNAFDEADFGSPKHEDVLAFQEAMLASGYATSIRESRGIEALAACGQLGQPGEADRWREAVREARRSAS